MKYSLKRRVMILLGVVLAGTSMTPGTAQAEETWPAAETEITAFGDELTVSAEESVVSEEEPTDIIEEPETDEDSSELSGEDPKDDLEGKQNENPEEAPGASDTDGADETAEIQIEDIVELTPQEASAYEETQERSGTCGLKGAPVNWRFQDGVLFVSGNGPMDDFMTIRDAATGELISSNEQPWKSFADEIKEVVIEEGVTTIGYAAFCRCFNLEKATIASTVTYIRHDAFLNDSNLTEVDMGSGVEKVETRIFGKTGLTSLTLPASLKQINTDAFIYLDKLQNVYVEEGGIYQSVDGVLYKDGGKTLEYFPTGRTGSYRVPEGTVKISEDAFSTGNLSELIIPDTVTEIGDSAFDHCASLTSVVFPASLRVIPPSACWYSKSLSSVVIPEGVEEIGEYAFSGCDALSEVTLPSTIKSIGMGAFQNNVVLINQNKGLIRQADGSYVDGIRIRLSGNAKYGEAFEVLRLVNEERRKEGLSELVMNENLMKTAMLRAAEVSLRWGHERPTGSLCFSADLSMYAENIASGSRTAQGAMNQWMNSEGHRYNILTPEYQSIGIGVVECEGAYYWVQCFGIEADPQTTASAWEDKRETWDILVKKDPNYYKEDFKLTKNPMLVGESCELEAYWGASRRDISGYIAESSDPSVCAVEEDGTLCAVGAGTAEITVYHEEYKEAARVLPVRVVTTQEETQTKVRIAYEPNGGKVNEKYADKRYGSAFGKLPDPMRKGYAFLGWYTAGSGGRKITSSTEVTSENAMTLYAHWKKIEVGRATVKRLKNLKGKKLKVTIKGVSGADGYQIVYARNAKFKKGKKSVFTARKSKKLSGLKKGKTYYVKVRAYVIDSSGAKVYGKYSKVKKIKYRAGK